VNTPPSSRKRFAAIHEISRGRLFGNRASGISSFGRSIDGAVLSPLGVLTLSALVQATGTKGRGHMDEWHEFFFVEAGVAAVLTGLVFIGVSSNVE
jgi:hypothetical protein